MKKYELTEDIIEHKGTTLYRIKAIRDFGDVKKGELGGYIGKANKLNLSHYGNSWVYGNARVYGDAWVSDNARVYGDAEVYGDARVFGNATVFGDAKVYDNAWVSGNATVFGDAKVYDNAWVSDNARVYGNTLVCGDAKVYEEKGDTFNSPTEETSSAYDRQEAGNHYAKLKIQPMQYALANELNYGQSNAIKYLTRYKDKNGIEDLKKAIHCIELLIEYEESNIE